MREGVGVAGKLSVKGWLPQGLCFQSPWSPYERAALNVAAPARLGFALFLSPWFLQTK